MRLQKGAGNEGRLRRPLDRNLSGRVREADSDACKRGFSAANRSGKQLVLVRQKILDLLPKMERVQAAAVVQLHQRIHRFPVAGQSSIRISWNAMP